MSTSDREPADSAGGGAAPRILHPRTIDALGVPVPMPPLEALTDPTWQPTVADAVGDAASDPGSESGGRRMLRNNVVVASGTLVSRATGLVRTSLILITLGQGLNDAYVNANNTPNMIYELILGGVLTATLVPLFTDDLERGKDGEATSAIISFALVALVVVTLLAVVAAPLLILLLSTGSAASRRHDYLAAGIPLALLFAPQVFFYGLMAVWSAVLNARHRFLAAAWAPVLNNIVAIGALLWAGSFVAGNPTLGDALDDRRILWVLGLGTTFGIVLMALALYPAVRRSGVRLRFRFQPRHPAVQKAIRLSGWTFGYVVANQIALIIIQILAKPSSGDPTRYQTAFQYFQLPHGLLAVSIMVTFEPLLGRADARGDRDAFNRHLLLGFRLIGLLVIPAAVGYIALPKGLDARTFTATGQLATVLGLTSIIAAFAVGLPAFSTYLYALRAFYARKDTKTPFLINGVENIVNVVLGVVLVRIWGVVGLALAFSIAYVVAAGVSVAILSRHSPGFDLRGLLVTWSKLLVAAGIMGALVYLAVRALAPSSPLALIPAVGTGLAVGGVTYAVAIAVLRVPGISELLARLPGLRRFA